MLLDRDKYQCLDNYQNKALDKYKCKFMDSYKNECSDKYILQLSSQEFTSHRSQAAARRCTPLSHSPQMAPTLPPHCCNTTPTQLPRHASSCIPPPHHQYTAP